VGEKIYIWNAYAVKVKRGVSLRVQPVELSSFVVKMKGEPNFSCLSCVLMLPCVCVRNIHARESCPSSLLWIFKPFSLNRCFHSYCQELSSSPALWDRFSLTLGLVGLGPTPGTVLGGIGGIGRCAAKMLEK